VGKLLTVGRLVSTVAEKSALYAAHGALAVEMESLAVAEVCQGRNVPFLAIRAVTDPAHESLPPGVERLLRAKTLAGRLGAAVGDILRRPASIKQLYNLWETALMAADALGRFLTQVLTGHTAVRARHPQAKNSPDEKSSLSGNPDIL
jgi:adenosylhomocysteine nucleosidase